MSSVWKGTLVTAAIFCCYCQLAAQGINKVENQENTLHHRVALVMAHSYIPAANEVNGETTIFIAPTIGFNYELWLNEKWAVGLHNDFIIQSFNIENENSKPHIKREYPILSALVAVYKPGNHWTFFGGPGKEFEKNENFNVIKTGLEYGVALPGSFEVSFGLEYDTKIKGYDSWLAGIGISKNFFHHRSR